MINPLNAGTKLQLNIQQIWQGLDLKSFLHAFERGHHHILTDVVMAQGNPVAGDVIPRPSQSRKLATGFMVAKFVFRKIMLL